MPMSFFKNFQTRFSFRIKIAILLLAAAIIPIVIINFIAARVVERFFHIEFEGQLSEFAQGFFFDMDHHKDDLKQAAQDVHNRWHLANATRLKDMVELEHILGLMLTLRPNLVFSIYDVDGNLLASTMGKEKATSRQHTTDDHDRFPKTDVFEISASPIPKINASDIIFELDNLQPFPSTNEQRPSSKKEAPLEKQKKKPHASDEGGHEEHTKPVSPPQALPPEDPVLSARLKNSKTQAVSDISIIKGIGLRQDVCVSVVDPIYQDHVGFLRVSSMIDDSFLHRMEDISGTHIALFGPNAQLLTSTLGNNVPFDLTKLQKLSNVDVKQVAFNVVAGQETFHTLAVRIKGESPDVKGFVAFSADETFFRQTIKKIRRMMGFAFLILFFLIILISWKLSTTVTDPIHRIVETTKDIAQGCFSCADHLQWTPHPELNQLSDGIRTMAHDLKESRAQLLAERNFVEEVIRSMIDSIVIVTHKGVIQRVNKATVDLLEYDEKELLGKPQSVLFSSDERLPNKARLQRLMVEQSVKDVDLTYQTKAGEHIPMSYSGFVVKDTDGNPIGVVNVAKDMREYVRLMEEAKKAAAAAAASEQARLDAEIKTAKLVQRTLLPRSLPKLDEITLDGFYQPATEVGGDWWGYVQIKDELVVMIADVTGHGAGAAVLTAAIQSAVVTITHLIKQGKKPFDPAAFLSTLNQTIFETTQGKTFVTFFCASIHIPTGNVSYSNAGHNFPWVFRNKEARSGSSTSSARKAVESLTLSGPHIGRIPDAQFTKQNTQLKPGDTLLLYTDGIPEQVNPEGNEYGTTQFHQSFAKHGHLPAEQLKQNLIDDVSRFKGDGPLLDDWTLVVIQYQDANSNKQVA